MSSERIIHAEPLTRAAFAPFGDVIDRDGTEQYPINSGGAVRHHALGTVDVTGRAVFSIVRGKPRELPLTVAMMERHPLGSQAFHPLSSHPFLVVVAPDEGGAPGRPRAFLTKPGQGVNYARATWHAVLTPLEAESDFLVVDRGDEGPNCEEHHFAEPWTIVAR